jgi:hypothetical protein
MHLAMTAGKVSGRNTIVMAQESTEESLAADAGIPARSAGFKEEVQSNVEPADHSF